MKSFQISVVVFACICLVCFVLGLINSSSRPSNVQVHSSAAESYLKKQRVELEESRILPDLLFVRQTTSLSKDAALLKAKQLFYERCIENIRWAAGNGYSGIMVWYHHGTKDDHEETLKRLAAAGYKLDHWTKLGVRISWE